MTTTAQLNYANYLISKLKVSEQFKARLREEVESMNFQEIADRFENIAISSPQKLGLKRTAQGR